MSDENAELVRQSHEAWNRGDLEWQLEHLAPDYEFVTAHLFPDVEAIYRGKEGFTTFWNTFREPWETLLVELERVEPVGDDRVLAMVTFHGSGRDVLEVTLKMTNLFTLENGLASRQVGFSDWQEALEAAGLSE